MQSCAVWTENGQISGAAANNAYVVEWNADDVLDQTDELIYTFAPGRDAGGRFAIDADTGLITVANGALLDYETTTSHDITVRVSDNNGYSFDRQLTVTLLEANDAPVLDNTGSMTLTPIVEGERDNNGNLVAEILASDGDRISDVDIGAVDGIAVTSVGDTNGTWEYSTNNGASWTAFGTVSESSAVVLTATANDRIRFVPNTNFNGVASFTVRAWDTTDGAASGSTGVDTTTNGGGTAFSVAQETVGIAVTPIQIVLYASTSADVTAAGAPGLDDWSAGDVLGMGDPNFDPEPGTTDGTFYSQFHLGDFAADGNAQISALHYVQSNITLGGNTQPAIDLLAGDLLIAVDEDGDVFTGSNAVSITSNKKDVFVFRPDTAGDYTSGTFFILLDNIGTDYVGGISMVEQPTLVGDQPLAAGTFLLNLGNSSDIMHFTASDVGVGSTLGTMSTLIAGADIGLGSGTVHIAGLDLLEDDISFGATTLHAGNILVVLDGNDTDVGTNNLSVTANDVFYLDVRTTTMMLGTTDADAVLFLEGPDVGLETRDEEIDALSMVVTFGGGNLDPLIALPSGSVTFTENDGPTLIDINASVLDVDASNFDGGVLSVDFTAGSTANDRLAINHQGSGTGEVGVSGSNVTYEGVTIGTFSGGGSGSSPLLITFNVDSTQAAVEAVLQNITYENVSDNPDTTSRTVRAVLTDGQLGTSNVETETINVLRANDVPIALNDAYSVNKNAVLTVDALTGVLANDSDVDLDSLTANVLVGPTDGSLVFDSATGAFTYTPDPGFAGTDSFTYVAYDGTVNSAITTVTITVDDVNLAPTDIAPNSFSVEEFINTTGGYSLGTLTATDPDSGETFTYSIQPGGDGALFSIGGVGNDELLIDDGVLNAATQSSYAVTVRVTDSAFNTYDEVLTVNVTATTAGWVLTGDTSVTEGDAATYMIRVIESIPKGSSAAVDLTLADIDTDSADYANFVTAINDAIAGRNDLTFDGTTLTYTPTDDYAASYNATGGGFVDISGSGTNLNLGDEDNSLANIGFSFDFYGNTETQLFVHDNGYVTFGSGINNQYNNQSMASGTALGGRPAIAAFWDDMDPSAAGDVYVATIGTAGNREFIVQWHNVPYYNGGTTQTGRYQIVLSEATGEIEMRYDDTDFNGTGHDDGRSATIAIQNGSGLSVQHSFNTASVAGGSTLTFAPTANSMVPLTFTLPIVNDESVEGNEDFSILLSNPVGTTLSGVNEVVTTIVDDDLAPIATDNTNDVVEDVTLTASGNLITDDDGFGVDFVDSTIATTSMNWSDEFTDGETLSRANRRWRPDVVLVF